MAALYFIAEIMSLFMVFDVSREYDLKENEQLEVNRRDSTDDTTELCNLEMSNDNSPMLINTKSHPSIISVFKILLHDFDAMLILAMSFFSMYLMISLDMWLPLLIIDKMEWTIIELNLVVLGSGLASVGLVLIVILKKPSDQQVFLATLFAMVAYVLLLVNFITLVIRHGNQAYNVFMCLIYAVSFAIVTIMEEVFLIGCLAKLVSSRIQTLSESIRLSISWLGALPALLTAALIFEWIQIVGCVYIGICIVFFILLVLRRNILARPTVKLC